MKVHILYDGIAIALDVSSADFKYMKPEEEDDERLDAFKENFLANNWACIGVSALKQLKKD